MRQVHLQSPTEGIIRGCKSLGTAKAASGKLLLPSLLRQSLAISGKIDGEDELATLRRLYNGHFMSNDSQNEKNRGE
ncbi:conserved hypothetical protein [Ricinus communis]|uniref:Uncharacterized protein n=1 Tax=Ricinus communis TaxID=3988 RepID=B9RJ07_RICCO|nr:conserved hypothetical protein [Ricinus communis]